MSDQNRFIVAANQLEELKIYMHEIIKMLREDGPHAYNGDAYAQVYELRREIGYVVRELGAGIPASSSLNWNK